VAIGGSFREAARQAGLWLYRIGVDMTEETIDPPPLQQHFSALKAYYDEDNLYSRIRQRLDQSDEAQEFFNILNLRSPAFEAVEFHVGHWFPGTLPEALPIDEASKLNKKGRDAITKVWEASNFNSKKQVFARTVCWSGNGFMRVSQRDTDGMPYFQVMEPQYVRDFRVDERGFVTYLRYAYPVSRGEGKNKVKRYKTEVWDKRTETLRIYEDHKPIDDATDYEGRVRIITFKSMGVDFIPIVWSPFMEASPGMGMGVFEPHLDRIDNLNRAATRLDDMLFRYNRSVWGLESAGLTADNVEMPPPEVAGSYATAYTNLSEDERTERGFGGVVRHPDGTLTLGNDPFMKMPMGWTLKSLVPAVDYQGAINIIDAHMEVLKRDMPELRYNDAIESQARDSAKVLQLQLAGAIDRANEGRANAEAAIIRACQIAITIGQKGAGRSREVREMFSGLPTFESGGLDFTFKPRPVVVPTPTDEAQEEVAQAQAVTEKVNVLKGMGLSTKVLLPDVAELIGVDEKDLEEDETLMPEGVEGEGGVVGETNNIVASVLGQARGGVQKPAGGARPGAPAQRNGGEGAVARNR
jgi:hypothetical protein